MEAPVFIGGQERSGTSMIRSVIGSHPDIAIFEYDLPLWRSIYPEHRRYWGEVPNRELALKMLEAIYGNEKLLQSAYKPDRARVEKALNGLNLEAITDYTALAGAVFGALLEEYRLVRGRKRWGLKTPTNEFFADEIFSVHPDAKFVHVYRNVFSMISSLKKLGWIQPGDQHLARRIIEWNRSLEALLVNLHRYRGRYLGIRYENFVEDPKTYLKLICGFLGIDYREEMLEMRGHPGGWKGSNSAFSASARTISPELAKRPVENLSDHERAIIQVICQSYELYMRERYPGFRLSWLEAESLTVLGEELLKEDQELALLAFRKAVDVEPSHRMARRDLDRLLREVGGDMSEAEEDAHRTSARAPEIVDVRPHVAGVDVTIRCRVCGHTFDRYQPTVAGAALGRHICPQCQAVYEVWPEEFIKVLDRFLPPRDFEEMLRMNEEVTRIAGTWYQAKPMASLLTYRGVNLGEPTERELAAFITQGLYAAQEGREAHER